DALGTGGVNVKSTDTLKIAAANETAFLNMEETSNLTLDADLTVAKATLGNTKLAAGTYTSADYPNFISGSGKLIVTEGEATGQKELLVEADFTQIVPNPVLKTAWVLLSSERNQLCEIQIVGLDGTLIRRMKEMLRQGENRISVDMDDVAPGMYLLVILREGEVETCKVVKQ
ncbi:MAG: T9SS type A sorting domain-containing protein, partial [Paludibacteraceae bacterium]